MRRVRTDLVKVIVRRSGPHSILDIELNQNITECLEIQLEGECCNNERVGSLNSVLWLEELNLCLFYIMVIVNIIEGYNHFLSKGKPWYGLSGLFPDEHANIGGNFIISWMESIHCFISLYRIIIFWLKLCGGWKISAPFLSRQSVHCSDDYNSQLSLLTPDWRTMKEVFFHTFCPAATSRWTPTEK